MSAAHLPAVAIGYLATSFGWSAPFVLASAFCLVSAALFSRIYPGRTVVGGAREIN
jgi:hypothetical protein